MIASFDGCLKYLFPFAFVNVVYRVVNSGEVVGFEVWESGVVLEEGFELGNGAELRPVTDSGARVLGDEFAQVVAHLLQEVGIVFRRIYSEVKLERGAGRGWH